MSTDDKGRSHEKPCGDESCGIFDIARWRSQAGKELELALPWRDKMTAPEKARIDKFANDLRVQLPQNIPGSVTQAVYVWANLAGDIEALRLEVERRQTTTPSGDDDDDDDKEDDTSKWPDFPKLPDLSGNTLAVDAFRGANFGGFMPLVAAVGIAAFAIWSKPARTIKGRLSK